MNRQSAILFCPELVHHALQIVRQHARKLHAPKIAWVFEHQPRRVQERTVEPGETADAAAERECEEEIGLVPGRIERLRGLFPTPGFCDEELIFFRVSALRPPDPEHRRQPDDDEDIQAEVFTVAEAHAMAARGDIIDLKTAYGLTLI